MSQFKTYYVDVKKKENVIRATDVSFRNLSAVVNELHVNEGWSRRAVAWRRSCSPGSVQQGYSIITLSGGKPEHEGQRTTVSLHNKLIIYSKRCTTTTCVSEVMYSSQVRFRRWKTWAFIKYNACSVLYLEQVKTRCTHTIYNIKVLPAYLFPRG